MKESPVLIPQSTTATPLPSVSVLLPVRNAEATIGAAIDSVLSQDYKGSVEVIVADGSDTAATSDLVRRPVPGSDTGSQSGTGHRVRNPRGAAGGDRRDHRAVRRPYGVPTGICAPRGEHVAKDGGGQCRRPATARRRHVLRARGGDGDDHSPGGWRRPLPAGRRGGARRHRLPGRVPARLRWRRRAASTLPLCGPRTTNSTGGCGARGETVWFDPGSWSTTGPATPCGTSLGNISITADGSGSWRNDIRPPCCSGISPARCCCWDWPPRRSWPWPAPPGWQRQRRSRTSSP